MSNKNIAVHPELVKAQKKTKAKRRRRGQFGGGSSSSKSQLPEVLYGPRIVQLVGRGTKPREAFINLLPIPGGNSTCKHMFVPFKELRPQSKDKYPEDFDYDALVELLS